MKPSIFSVAVFLPFSLGFTSQTSDHWTPPETGLSKYSPALPVALFCEPLKAARKAFSESVSQSEVAIGFLSPIPDSDRDTDSDANSDL